MLQRSIPGVLCKKTCHRASALCCPYKWALGKHSNGEQKADCPETFQDFVGEAEHTADEAERQDAAEGRGARPVRGEAVQLTGL